MTTSQLRVLQIGAGSMGTRRLRDLHQRKDVALALYDERADRCDAAQARFGVRVFATFEDALKWEPQALIVSTPPGAKSHYIDLAFERGMHHFSEADIWTYGAAARSAAAKGLVSTSSCSLNFLPVIKGLRGLVHDHLGSLLSYHHALGFHMPGWHPQEGNEYYGRHRDTAPAREMVCFDLHFLNSIFSPAIEVACRFERYGELPADTEDTWSLLLRLKNGGTGHLTSTMACPRDYRRGCCFGSKGWATWDLYSGEVTFSSAMHELPRQYQFGTISSVLDAGYFEEINTFIDAVLGEKTWLQSYALCQESTATLAAAEQSSTTGMWVKVDPKAEPHRSPPSHR